ncbi:MAG: hypothetical protein II183_02610 [Elusimicrobiaceae bacterium]|nr:hypothetical protein [Elusimicrobiaceae bacterium]
MKKLLITVVMVCVGVVAINAQLVSKPATNPNNFSGDPACRNYNVNNYPLYCKNNQYGSYPCDLCPVCDEQGKLIKCGEGDLPANGACCVDVRIDLHRLNQLPANCKIDEGQSHPCGQCPVYYEKPKDKCVECTGQLGQLYPCCHVFEGQGGDGVCPGGVYKSGDPKGNINPAQQNSNSKGNAKGTKPTRNKSNKGKK